MYILILYTYTYTLKYTIYVKTSMSFLLSHSFQMSNGIVEWPSCNTFLLR